MTLSTLLAFRGIYFMHVHGIMTFRSCRYTTDPRLTFDDRLILLKSTNVSTKMTENTLACKPSIILVHKSVPALL